MLFFVLLLLLGDALLELRTLPNFLAGVSIGNIQRFRKCSEFVIDVDLRQGRSELCVCYRDCWAN